MKMQRILALLLAAVLCLSLGAAALAEPLPETTESLERADSRYLTLKRGKTLKLWSWGFSDTHEIYEWTNMLEETPVKGIRLKNVKGEVQATVTKGGDWLTATVKNGKVLLKVKGKNVKAATQTAVVKITDGKGTYGKVKLIRGGMVRFTSVKQTGTSIQLKLSLCKGVTTTYATIRRITYNTRGQVVNVTPSVGSIQPGSGAVTFVDTRVQPRAGYTYAYSVSYISPAFQTSMRTSAAAITVQKSYGNASGKVKTAAKSSVYYDDGWLYSLVH